MVALRGDQGAGGFFGCFGFFGSLRGLSRLPIADVLGVD
jgi:hypothetical protein